MFFFIFCLCFLIRIHTMAETTTRSRTVTDAHTEPTVVAKSSEFWCDRPGNTIVLGLGWAAEELKQAGSGTNSPESLSLVQAIWIRRIKKGVSQLSLKRSKYSSNIHH